MIEIQDQPPFARAKICSTFSSKGGSGKTTSSCIVAYGLAAMGLSTALIDADAQGASTSWLAAALPDRRLPIDVYSMASAKRTLSRQLEQLSTRYQVLVVDLPNSLAEETPMSSLLVSDLCLTPMRPTAPDLRAGIDAIHVVKAAQARSNPTLQHRILLNMYRNTNASNDVVTLLTESGAPVMSSRLGDRTAFQQAAAIGSVPQAMGSSHRVAAAECAALVAEVHALLFGEAK